MLQAGKIYISASQFWQYERRMNVRSTVIVAAHVKFNCRCAVLDAMQKALFLLSTDMVAV